MPSTVAAAAADSSGSSGVTEMNRLLEKFRQNREHRMQNQSNGNDDNENARPKVVHSPPSNSARMVNSPVVDKKVQSTLRPSPRPSLATRSRGHNEQPTTKRLGDLQNLGCVVASYVSGPQPMQADNALHFQASGALSDDDSDCSSYDPDECGKQYQFDNAYVVPTKSSINMAKGCLKNNIVVFSEEPPLAYVYLEENEAQIIGQWQSGDSITMESYFCIKEQMREDRNRSLENGFN